MKKHSILFFAAIIFSFAIHAQSLKGILKNAGKKDSSGNIVTNVLKNGSVSKGSLTNEESIKDAIEVAYGEAIHL